MNSLTFQKHTTLAQRPTLHVVGHPMLKLQAYNWSKTSFASNNSSHSSSKAFLQDLGVRLWESVPSRAKRAFVRSGTDVERDGLARDRRSGFWSRSRLCAGLSSSSASDSSNHVLMQQLPTFSGHNTASTGCFNS